MQGICPTIAAVAVFAALVAAQPAGNRFAPSAGEPAPAEAHTQMPVAASSTPPPLTAEARGDIYMARKMYREAAEMYLQGPRDSAITWNKVGIAFHQMQNLDSARRNYEKAVKLNPKYSEAINNLGTFWYARKNFKRAIALYRKALEVAPKSASIYSNLGTAYFARKRYKEAIETYQIALQLDPEVFEHRSSAGVLLQERSVQERAKFSYYMAKTYAKAGQTERALQYIRKSLEEGFKDKSKFMEDEDFASIRPLPEFDQLMKLEPRVL